MPWVRGSIVIEPGSGQAVDETGFRADNNGQGVAHSLLGVLQRQRGVEGQGCRRQMLHLEMKKQKQKGIPFGN